MRTLSTALINTQKGTQKIPHIHIVINSVDLSSRLLMLEHIEEAYRDSATLVFRNNDRYFDSLNFIGYRFRIGYGLYTGNNVAEPDGDGAGNEYSYAADLYVKGQQVTSMEGESACILICEGMWMRMRELRVMAYGTAPYYNFTFEATDTIYELIEHLVEGALGWTLSVTPSPDDGILNTFKPIFSVNVIPYETVAGVLYRLITMTKCYIRLRANNTVQIVYPQDTDSADETYYSYQQHFFHEFADKSNEVIPNRVVVFCNQDEDGGWDNLITGDTGAPTSNYGEILEPYILASITSQTNANNQAAAILARICMEQLAGRLIIPHDCGMELYDKVSVFDMRGF